MPIHSSPCITPLPPTVFTSTVGVGHEAAVRCARHGSGRFLSLAKPVCPADNQYISSGGLYPGDPPCYRHYCTPHGRHCPGQLPSLPSSGRVPGDWVRGSVWRSHLHRPLRPHGSGEGCLRGERVSTLPVSPPTSCAVPSGLWTPFNKHTSMARSTCIL
ncbi:hypothetical protein GBAR_LOCUS23040 [Geodia barretti]|uniref:Uncharacterized protein n=1 Tax=Geodia barretti TaxID=519541 RepID=A0AA35T616_GEOBA|nr:hypothetical protein GBAR_LOCUS23040 [Geodia barretti]